MDGPLLGHVALASISPVQLLTADDLGELVFETAHSGDHAGAARRLERMAAGATAPRGLTRAELLVAAGEQYRLAEDMTSCERAFRAAVADGGDAEPDARAYLAGALLETGQRDEAHAILDELRRKRSHDPWLYLHVGESLELTGDLGTATRWFTMGLMRALRSDQTEDAGVAILVRSRRRVRRAQGFPPDDYDTLVDAGRPSGPDD